MYVVLPCGLNIKSSSNPRKHCNTGSIRIKVAVPVVAAAGPAVVTTTVTHTHTHTQKISSRRRTVAGFIRVQCGRGARPALKRAQILRQPTHRNSFTSVASIVLCFANFSNNHAYNNGWEVHSFMSSFTFISVMSYVQVLLMLCSTLQPSR